MATPNSREVIEQFRRLYVSMRNDYIEVKTNNEKLQAELQASRTHIPEIRPDSQVSDNITEPVSSVSEAPTISEPPCAVELNRPGTPYPGADAGVNAFDDDDEEEEDDRMPWMEDIAVTLNGMD